MHHPPARGSCRCVSTMRPRASAHGGVRREKRVVTVSAQPFVAAGGTAAVPARSGCPIHVQAGQHEGIRPSAIPPGPKGRACSLDPAETTASAVVRCTGNDVGDGPVPAAVPRGHRSPRERQVDASHRRHLRWMARRADTRDGARRPAPHQRYRHVHRLGPARSRAGHGQPVAGHVPDVAFELLLIEKRSPPPSPPSPTPSLPTPERSGFPTPSLLLSVIV